MTGATLAGAAVQTKEIVELMGLDPTRVLLDTLRDVTIERGGESNRRVSFTIITPAGRARVVIEVDK